MYIGSSHLGDAISINVTADAAGDYIAIIPDNFLQNRIATDQLATDVDPNAYSFINDQSVKLNADYLANIRHAEPSLSLSITQEISNRCRQLRWLLILRHPEGADARRCMQISLPHKPPNLQRLRTTPWYLR